jgi:hypothetical protein
MSCAALRLKNTLRRRGIISELRLRTNGPRNEIAAAIGTPASQLAFGAFPAERALE